MRKSSSCCPFVRSFVLGKKKWGGFSIKNEQTNRDYPKPKVSSYYFLQSSIANTTPLYAVPFFVSFCRWVGPWFLWASSPTKITFTAILKPLFCFATQTLWKQMSSHWSGTKKARRIVSQVAICFDEISVVVVVVKIPHAIVVVKRLPLITGFRQCEEYNFLDNCNVFFLYEKYARRRAQYAQN